MDNSDAHFNENNTLTFRPRRKLVLRKDLSEFDPEQNLIVSPNIPLLGISSFVKEKFGYFTNLGLASLVHAIDSPSMKTLTAADYLFGHEDRLVTLANAYIPSWIDFSKFGIIDRIMALENDNNTITLHLTQDKNTDKEDIPLPYSINSFNGSPELKQWGFGEDDAKHSHCNTIEGAFDGGLFPRHLKENTTLRLYRRAFCRAINMKYEYTNTTDDGLQYYSYRVDQNFLSSSNENSDNHCFCKGNNKCLPKGFGSMAPCYYGIPIIMSQPHYLNGDSDILAQVNGLNPNKEKHDSVLKLNPTFGVPISANVRIQINLKVADNQIVRKSKPFQNMMIPLFWLELNICEMPFVVKLLLNISNAAPLIQIVTACILVLLGISVIATAWLFACYFPSHHNLEDPHVNVGYNPILVLPFQQQLKTGMNRLSQ